MSSLCDRRLAAVVRGAREGEWKKVSGRGGEGGGEEKDACCASIAHLSQYRFLCGSERQLRRVPPAGVAEEGMLAARLRCAGSEPAAAAACTADDWVGTQRGGTCVVCVRCVPRTEHRVDHAVNARASVLDVPERRPSRPELQPVRARSVLRFGHSVPAGSLAVGN